MLSIDGLFQSNRLAYIHTNDMPGQHMFRNPEGEQTEFQFAPSPPESVEPEDQR